VDTLKEIGVKPIHKSTKFDDLVQWIRTDLESAAPTHPRTPDAVAMATYWWRYGR